MENVQIRKTYSRNWQVKDSLSDVELTNQKNVQQILSEWYVLLREEVSGAIKNNLFPSADSDEILNKLRDDINAIPSLLMWELVNEETIHDKGQYIQLIQALLINCSNLVFNFNNQFSELCIIIENTINFLKDFFYRHFDLDFRVTTYLLEDTRNSLQLKLEYWKIKFPQPAVIDSLQEGLSGNILLPEQFITYRKINYLKHIISIIELPGVLISEEYIRSVLIKHNYNNASFIEYELERIKQKQTNEMTSEENIQLLKAELLNIQLIKIKKGFFFEPDTPSIKEQLQAWIGNEIKRLERLNHPPSGKDLIIDSESKIQTSLSVAKLAVLIRLLVADKVIINKTVAPMLRTVAKLFTTLQKDEISFGSLETKYHAPDKATLNIMKDMLQKWVALTGKL